MGRSFPTLENVLLKENASALTVCTDWSEVFKFRSIHVTPVSRQTGLKTEIEIRGKFKTHITNNQFQVRYTSVTIFTSISSFCGDLFKRH